MDFLTPQNHGVDTNITPLRQTMTDLLHFSATAAILDAILKKKKNTFPKVRFFLDF